MPPRPAMPLVRAQCTIGDGNRLVVPRRGEGLASWFQSGAALRRFRREHPTQVKRFQQGLNCRGFWRPILPIRPDFR